ncbi:Chloroplast envelope membrane protein (chloroplast) [Coccomyxa sp. Obi]|nr:Chloroplast envelope membrane protein [Coccomyxa sp. Obi]
MERQAFEPTGLVPRSIIRTFDRFRQQLLPETKAAAVQEFRISRYQVLVSVKSLLSLVLVPLVINFLAKTFLLNPTTEYLWNTQQNEIFLNSYQEDRALHEIHDFSEKVYFESLLGEEPAPTTMAMHKQDNQGSRGSQAQVSRGVGISLNGPQPPYWQEARKIGEKVLQPLRWDGVHWAEEGDGVRWPPLRWPGVAIEPPAVHPMHPLGMQGMQEGEAVANQFQDKAVELALIYNKESMLAITNVLGDFVTFVTIASLFVWMRPQIVILKSFLTESIYSLSDTTKSFLLILVTDLLVGFHSPRGWEIGIEMLLRHFGLPENQDFIFLFVAAFPVFLDTIFKYWIFRYLNKISPSTVATYHNMIE